MKWSFEENQDVVILVHCILVGGVSAAYVGHCGKEEASLFSANHSEVYMEVTKMSSSWRNWDSCLSGGGGGEKIVWHCLKATQSTEEGGQSDCEATGNHCLFAVLYLTITTIIPNLKMLLCINQISSQNYQSEKLLIQVQISLNNNWDQKGLSY